jgi:hypothetical protein
MPDLPTAMLTEIEACALLFSRRIFAYVKLLLMGAILAPGQRTVSAVLRVMGKSAEAHFQHDYRVLNRARSASGAATRGWWHALMGKVPDEGVMVVAQVDAMDILRFQGVDGVTAKTHAMASNGRCDTLVVATQELQREATEALQACQAAARVRVGGTVKLTASAPVHGTQRAGSRRLGAWAAASRAVISRPTGRL